MAYEPMYHALPMVNVCEIFWAFLVLFYFILVFYVLGLFWDVFFFLENKAIIPLIPGWLDMR